MSRKGYVIWLTGLPCSGKTTIAKKLKVEIDAIILDGDIIRDTHISEDLGFTREDREQHLMRMSSIARMFTDNGRNVICSFVSPYEEIRQRIKEEQRYMYIIHVKASVNACKERDVKGMWKKAEEGKIKNFTGKDAVYEVPENPDLVIETEKETPDESVMKICKFINDTHRSALYIGRWQAPSCLHDGHKKLIRQSLDKNIPVVIGVRRMLSHTNDNPHEAEFIKEMIDINYMNEDVEVVILPNIRSINYGRKVGYELIKHELDKETEKISSTKLRESNK